MITINKMTKMGHETLVVDKDEAWVQFQEIVEQGGLVAQRQNQEDEYLIVNTWEEVEDDSYLLMMPRLQGG